MLCQRAGDAGEHPRQVATGGARAVALDPSLQPSLDASYGSQCGRTTRRHATRHRLDGVSVRRRLGRTRRLCRSAGCRERERRAEGGGEERASGRTARRHGRGGDSASGSVTR